MTKQQETQTVASLKEARNAIEAQIVSIEENKTVENTQLLIHEVLNLMDGVGEGYTEGDHMVAPRYYSVIPGVKNIRMLTDCLLVKVNKDSGYLVPKSITVRGETFTIKFDASSNYKGACSY